MSRAPFVAIQTDIRKEERILVIAEIGGYNRHEALGRLVDLWTWCADRRLKDAPEGCEGYAVSEAIVRRFLGPRGLEAILGGGCDALALGEPRPDGLVYLRGTGETVRRLRAHQKTASAGGLVRSATVNRVNGKFVVETTNHQPAHQQATSSQPAGHQQPASRPPAETSVDPRSQIPDPKATSGAEERPPAAPAKPQRPQRAKVPIPPDWHPDRSEANVAAEQRATARGVDLGAERAKLVDWALSRDERKADWAAAWRYWLTNAKPTARAGHENSSLRVVMERMQQHQRDEQRGLFDDEV